EADQSAAAAAQQALEEGSPLLLCCLAGPVVRLGPLIDPQTCFGTAIPSPTPAQSPPSHPASASADPPPRDSTGAALPLNLYARLGALLVSAQALNFLLGARNQCVLDRVVELNPWSMESKGYRVFQN